MLPQNFAFHSPWYLLLLGLLPFLWYFSFHSLSGLGPIRRVVAIALRSVVMLLIILALADMQYRVISDRLAVIYLLDQSLSIPEERRAAMIQYVNASIEEQRREDRQDRVGVIVFGRNAEVEIPPVDFDIQLPRRIESLLDPEYTNLAEAMQRALAMFPHDAAKRIVVITDGNENIGNALEQARALGDAGVSIDVLPVPLDQRSEIAVSKVALPADVRRGQPFSMRVVVENNSPEGSPPVPGRLRVVRKAGDRETTLANEPIAAPPGLNVYEFREEITQSDFYTYEARFVPDDPAADAMAQNNLATAFTHVRGQGQVLLIEDWLHWGEFDYLVLRLREEGLEVTVQPSNQLFTSLPELQRYDTVILANVPRSSGEDAESVSSFSDAQIDMLVRNTEELGCGLIMMGGPNSFGAGGWANTGIEKAMPVDFDIKSARVIPVGALVQIMHAGEIAQGNYWQKVIAIEAIQALGQRDYAGLIQWSGSESWLWAQSQGGLARVGQNREMMKARVDRMQVGDMPQFDPSMKMAAAAFAALPPNEAAVKHMIIISDGDPQPPTPGTINALVQQKVTVTTVLVGQRSHSPRGPTVMRNIADQTSGKYYEVNNPNALPRIYQREARRVARPLVHEPTPPVQPYITVRHEIVQGLEGAFPPLSGFVLTTVKDNSLVDVILRSPTPVNEENSTVMAAWTYGLGKAVAFTTDAGERWTNPWTSWEHYDRLFSQMVRWSMRPSGDTGNFTVATDVQDGKTRVIVTALDPNDDFLNYQSMVGTVLGPNMESIPLDIQQTAPGRYVGEFDSTQAGSYMVMVTPGAGQAMLRTGVNVGYSDEFRDREANMALLNSMAEIPAQQSGPGQLLAPLRTTGAADSESLGPQLEVDPFRRDLPPAVASEDIWPLLVLLSSCLFLADVFVRRVQVDMSWLPPVWNRTVDFVLRRDRQAAAPETMSRLRSRKEEVDRQLETRRAATRFEPEEAAEAQADTSVLDQAQAKAGPAKAAAAKPERSISESDQPAEDSYTSRLLKAKKDVWKGKGPGEEDA